MAEEFRVLRPKEYHSQLVEKGQRSDGRSLDSIREFKLETDAIKTADSSSLVKLGNTSLVCGCTVQLLDFKDKEDDSDEIKITVELPPICSSPTGVRTHHTAQLLTKTLKDILEDSKCIDKQGLHCNDSDKFWSIDVEVICLNYDGSILDAALLAVLAALKTLRSPKDTDEKKELVKINHVPVCTSFAIIGGHIICDPNLEEESIASSTFSVTIDPSTMRCCHINKIGGHPLTIDELFKCIQLAKQRAQAPLIKP